MAVSLPKNILLIDPTMTGRNFRDRVKKSGYDVSFFTDLEDGQQWLLDGYAHLVILDESFIEKYPIQSTDYYPKVYKMLKLTQPHYKGENERAGELARGDFIDEIQGGDLEEFVKKVNRFFANYYKKFAWDLAIQDETGQPERLFGLAAKIDPTVADVFLSSRANELCDLFRFLFPDDQVVTLYPPLWIRDGLAAVEVMSVHKAGRYPERSLLVLGLAGEIKRAQDGYLDCQPDSSIPGVTKKMDDHVINHFGAIKYDLNGWRGHGTRLITAAEWIHRRGDPHLVAKTMLRVIQQGSQLYFSPRMEQVEPLANVRRQLGLAENETLLNQVTGRVNEWFAQPCWSGFAAVQASADSLGRPVWKIAVGGGPALWWKQQDLRRVLHAMDLHRGVHQCTTAPGLLRLSNLIIEDSSDCQELGWISDFRMAGERTCGLYNLTHYAAELRYCLARPAGFQQRVALERSLLDPTGDGKLTHPAALAAGDVIRHFCPLPEDPEGQVLHTRAMLLHAIARFLQIMPVSSDVQVSQDAMVLIASMALMTNGLADQPGDRGALLKRGTRKNEFLLMGQSFTLQAGSAQVLYALLDREDHTLTYGGYQKEVLGNHGVGLHKKHVELLQTYIYRIRKKIESLDTGLGEGAGERIIISIDDGDEVKDKGYRLVLDLDLLA